MTTQETIEFYGTQRKVADKLDITQAAVAGWGVYPPAIRQLQLERITRGRLRAEPDVFNKKPGKAA